MQSPIRLGAGSSSSLLRGAANSSESLTCREGLEHPKYIGGANIVECIINASGNAGISISNINSDRGQGRIGSPASPENWHAAAPRVISPPQTTGANPVRAPCVSGAHQTRLLAAGQRLSA